MNPHHLSPGDLITFRGKPCRICLITEGEISCIDSTDPKVPGNGYALKAADPGLAPITITPDILFANDFTSEPQMGFVSADGRITLDPSIPNYPRQWYAHVDNDDFQSIASADIDYLHQLQHLLRICNIEKEWKL